MENILRKALDEALTKRYSGELNSAAEVKHGFSGDFERKMKGLIRRVDKPFFHYSKYIAAAACAVVAIGCAVLLPALMNGKIEVNAPTDAAAAETAPPTGNDESAVITTTVPPKIPSEEESAVTEGAAEPIETTDSTAPVLTQPADEEMPVNTGGTTAKDSGNTTEETISKNETTGEFEESIWDEEEADIDIGDKTDDVFDSNIEEDDCDVSDDDGYNPSTGWDESDDDAVIDDSDDDVAIDDDADIDTDIPTDDDSDLNPGCGGGSGYEHKPIPDGANFGEIVSLTYGGSYENLKAASCYYDGISISFGDTDTDFTQEFIASLKSAKPVRYEEEPAITKNSKPISLEIRDVAFVSERRTENFSDWLFYGETFGTGDEQDMSDEESIWEKDYGTFFVNMEIYSDGTVKLFYIGDFAKKIDYSDYNLYLKADKAAAAKLFSKFSALKMPENAKTAGNLIDYFAINKANITGADADIRGIYDTGYAAVPVSSAAVEEFFSEYASAAVTAYTPDDHGFGDYYSVNIENCSPNDTYESRRWWFNDFYDGDNKICMRLPLKNKGGALWVSITSNICYIRNELGGVINNKGYRFEVKPESVIKLYKRILSENNLTSITYDSLSQYLKGKNFTDISEGAYYKVTGSSSKKTNIDDSEKLKKLTAAIKAEAKNSAYVPLGGYGKGLVIRIYVENWKVQLLIYQNNMISINGNNFAASEGFYDKLIAIIEG